MKFKHDDKAVKVISWRILSTILCALLGRLWFGDWHVTTFGLFLAVIMTMVHYVFECCWGAIRNYGKG
jgi:uncharacterized membrane protein